MPIQELYFALRLWVGGYFLYWGLNGFLAWSSLPPASPAFESFIGRLHAIPGLMNLVKILEILAGVALILGWVIWGLGMLAPIVLVIVLSHLLLNFRRGWKVALIVALPFGLLAFMTLNHA